MEESTPRPVSKKPVKRLASNTSSRSHTHHNKMGLPTKAVKMKTPLEAWSGVKPSLSNLKKFGRICYTYIPSVKQDKLDQKGEVGVFIGYNEQSKAYRVYQQSNGRVLIRRDIKFLEDEEWN
ncbi:hypothetical protein CRG98_005145 [Punica granatum]|uniref:Retroviral polymerase SH3-like domain-containing protein n=1 Tax=Punica granatum TaxID=22663 RepID=A0A2I0L1G9_PUNGR|nr:hypothetical protein CRG98_005145 [Punica granatum]